MNSNGNGFSLIEVLTSFCIVMTLFITFVPIYYQIKLEQQLLADRRNIQSALHDQLQPYLWMADSQFPIDNLEEVGKMTVTFSFTNENQLIKGCANWENVKQRQEDFCIYGYPSQ